MQQYGPQEAAVRSIDFMEHRVAGKGGVISIDKMGNYGIHFNTGNIHLL